MAAIAKPKRVELISNARAASLADPDSLLPTAQAPASAVQAPTAAQQQAQTRPLQELLQQEWLPRCENVSHSLILDENPLLRNCRKWRLPMPRLTCSSLRWKPACNIWKAFQMYSANPIPPGGYLMPKGMCDVQKAQNKQQLQSFSSNIPRFKLFLKKSTIYY